MSRTEKVDPVSETGKKKFKSNSSGRIILGLINDVPEVVLSTLSTHLHKEFGVPVEHIELEKDVSFAFNRRRNQYSSPKILDRLRKINREPQDKLLGIVDVDLYCPDYDFVFGEADADAGVATLSIYRLKQGISDPELIASRIIKEATHEIGHLFNLGHCDDPRCVMSFSIGNLWQIDAKSASLCKECHLAGKRPVTRTIRN